MGGDRNQRGSYLLGDPQNINLPGWVAKDT
jgi:hypothetical protein